MSTLWVEKLTRFDRDRPTTWANGRKDNALESRRFLAHLSQRRFYGKWSEFDSIRIKSFHGSDGVEGGTGGRQWQRNQRKDERIKSKGLHGRNSILIQWRGKKKAVNPWTKKKKTLNDQREMRQFHCEQVKDSLEKTLEPRKASKTRCTNEKPMTQTRRRPGHQFIHDRLGRSRYT